MADEEMFSEGAFGVCRGGGAGSVCGGIGEVRKLKRGAVKGASGRVRARRGVRKNKEHEGYGRM